MNLQSMSLNGGQADFSHLGDISNVDSSFIPIKDFSLQHITEALYPSLPHKREHRNIHPNNDHLQNHSSTSQSKSHRFWDSVPSNRKFEVMELDRKYDAIVRMDEASDRVATQLGALTVYAKSKKTLRAWEAVKKTQQQSQDDLSKTLDDAAVPCVGVPASPSSSGHKNNTVDVPAEGEPYFKPHPVRRKKYHTAASDTTVSHSQASPRPAPHVAISVVSTLSSSSPRSIIPSTRLSVRTSLPGGLPTHRSIDTASSYVSGVSDHARSPFYVPDETPRPVPSMTQSIEESLSHYVMQKEYSTDFDSASHSSNGVGVVSLAMKAVQQLLQRTESALHDEVHAEMRAVEILETPCPAQGDVMHIALQNRIQYFKDMAKYYESVKAEVDNRRKKADRLKSKLKDAIEIMKSRGNAEDIEESIDFDVESGVSSMEEVIEEFDTKSDHFDEVSDFTANTTETQHSNTQQPMHVPIPTSPTTLHSVVSPLSASTTRSRRGSRQSYLNPQQVLSSSPISSSKSSSVHYVPVLPVPNSPPKVVAVSPTRSIESWSDISSYIFHPASAEQHPSSTNESTSNSTHPVSTDESKYSHDKENIFKAGNVNYYQYDSEVSNDRKSLVPVTSGFNKVRGPQQPPPQVLVTQYSYEDKRVDCDEEFLSPDETQINHSKFDSQRLNASVEVGIDASNVVADDGVQTTLQSPDLSTVLVVGPTIEGVNEYYDGFQPDKDVPLGTGAKDNSETLDVLEMLTSITTWRTNAMDQLVSLRIPRETEEEDKRWAQNIVDKHFDTVTAKLVQLRNSKIDSSSSSEDSESQRSNNESDTPHDILITPPVDIDRIQFNITSTSNTDTSPQGDFYEEEEDDDSSSTVMSSTSAEDSTWGSEDDT